MNLDKLFNALPRDLQWEVLTEFVGTHVVRNGKLMRKLVMTTPHKTLKHHIFHTNPKCPWHYSKYGTITTNFVTPCFLSEAVQILSHVQMSDDGYRIMYCVNRKQSYIIFRTATKIVEGREIWDDERFLIDDSVILEPFIKHDYPSYPFTNKKMGRRNCLH
jgi:hypothetical protein